MVQKLNKKMEKLERIKKRRLKIHSQKPLRTKQGKLAKKQPPLLFMSKEISESARIQPDRRWFGNTRVINQTHLEDFRKAMNIETANPFKIILKRRKLPISLLEEPKEVLLSYF